MEPRVPRNCPKCSARSPLPMTPIKHGVVEIDACPGCFGVWLDGGEWRPVVGQALSVTRPPSVRLGPALPCPACPPDAPRPRVERARLVPRGVEGVEDLEIDLCPACGGAWLDAGELQQLHDRLGRAAGGAVAEEPAPRPAPGERRRAAFARRPEEAMGFLEAVVDTWRSTWRR